MEMIWYGGIMKGSSAGRSRRQHDDHISSDGGVPFCTNENDIEYHISFSFFVCK